MLIILSHPVLKLLVAPYCLLGRFQTLHFRNKFSSDKLQTIFTFLQNNLKNDFYLYEPEGISVLVGSKILKTQQS